MSESPAVEYRPLTYTVIHSPDGESTVRIGVAPDHLMISPELVAESNEHLAFDPTFGLFTFSDDYGRKVSYSVTGRADDGAYLVEKIVETTEDE
jgi:hypothetical protein